MSFNPHRREASGAAICRQARTGYHRHVSILTGGKPPVQRPQKLPAPCLAPVSILTGGKPPVQLRAGGSRPSLNKGFNPHRREASGAATAVLKLGLNGISFNPHRREASGAAVTIGLWCCWLFSFNPHRREASGAAPCWQCWIF